MPETIELTEVQGAVVQSPSSIQTFLWKEVMQAIDYPPNWGEEIKLLLAAEGKTFRWAMKEGGESD